MSMFAQKNASTIGALVWAAIATPIPVLPREKELDMSSRDFSRQIDHVDISKYNYGETRDRGIRLYCSASAEVHGADNARYPLQIFAPLKLANGREGRDYMIATASLSLQDLVAIRAEIDAAIAEVENVALHEASPSRTVRARVAGTKRVRSTRTKKRSSR